MIRYQLDDLGWFQFEWLIQSLLKFQLGLGVESWGTSGDYGKDAYFRGSLLYPSKQLATYGVFVFQVKFVDGANASGSKSDTNLLSAVQKESSRIRTRKKKHQWDTVDHYTLITNAPVSAALRTKLNYSLNKQINEDGIHILGGNDVCDMLDSSKNIRRSFPQLLSLRDLNQLLSETVNGHILENSKAAIDWAREIVPSFVPTEAYIESIEKLVRYNFIILEGPPEMGKSSIAWMITLNYIADGWTAIVCSTPEDIFRTIERDNRQIFIVDDAFGRTEYNPTLGRSWERDMHKILTLMSRTKRMIWTSRRHILERALHDLELQGNARRIPKLASVTVLADSLSLEERALILYRHAKSAHLNKTLREVVRLQAQHVITSINFTPERIRRLIRETIPDIIERNIDVDDNQLISFLFEKSVSNPSQGMRRSFEKLPRSHKWLLISLLEIERYATFAAVQSIFENKCPLDDSEPFLKVVEELVGGFLMVRSQKYIDWIHPSYRDMVIDEVSINAPLRHRFLETMAVQGIILATSVAGGEVGGREFPFIRTLDDWNSLRTRCIQIAESGSRSETLKLLEALSNFVDAIEIIDQGSARSILSSVCIKIQENWDGSGELILASELATFVAASIRISPLPRLPQLTNSLHAAELAARRAADQAQQGGVLDSSAPSEWVDLIYAIQRSEPRLLAQKEYLQSQERTILSLIEAMNSDLEIDSSPDFDSESAFRDESERLSSLADSFENLAPLAPPLTNRLEELASRGYSRAIDLEQEADSLERDHDWDDGDWYTGEATSSEDLSLEDLFSDL